MCELSGKRTPHVRLQCKRTGAIMRGNRVISVNLYFGKTDFSYIPYYPALSHRCVYTVIAQGVGDYRIIRTCAIILAVSIVESQVKPQIHLKAHGRIQYMEQNGK